VDQHLLGDRGYRIHRGFTYLTPVSLIHLELPALWISSVAVVIFASPEADMRAPNRPSYRALLESSLNQPRVGKALPVNGFDEAVEPLKRVPFHVAIVQTEGELVNVAVQVLRTGVMVDAVHPAFHHRPNALDRVRIHVACTVSWPKKSPPIPA
jgi:hypothetical protein